MQLQICLEPNKRNKFYLLIHLFAIYMKSGHILKDIFFFIGISLSMKSGHILKDIFFFIGISVERQHHRPTLEKWVQKLMEVRGIEPRASRMRSERSTI